jgi:hypothetical protein
MLLPTIQLIIFGGTSSASGSITPTQSEPIPVVL